MLSRNENDLSNACDWMVDRLHKEGFLKAQELTEEDRSDWANDARAALRASIQQHSDPRAIIAQCSFDVHLMRTLKGEADMLTHKKLGDKKLKFGDLQDLLRECVSCVLQVDTTGRGPDSESRSPRTPTGGR